ncbi:MAG: TetR/AcrR family transcriptional regulator [Acidobacteriota bacterium]
MPTQKERRAATRAKLIAAGREHFARDGYEATRTSDILGSTGLSRGALYHHFQDKRELFEAVFVDVSTEAIELASRRGKRSGSSLELLMSSCASWLRVARRPEVASILLDQGPSVLGWRRAGELESQTSLSLMMSSLESAVRAGEVEVASVELTARLLNALLAEAALAGLYGGFTGAQQEAAVRQFLEGLRPTS